MSIFDKLAQTTTNISDPFPDPTAEPGQDEDLVAHSTIQSLAEQQHSLPAKMSAKVSPTPASTGMDKASELAGRVSDTTQTATADYRDAEHASMAHRVAAAGDMAMHKANEAMGLNK